MMNNFDKNIEDYGWGEMKKLLDKQMPEGGGYIPAAATDIPLPSQKDKDKRRWLIFFLLVSGILMSGLGYYFYQNPMSKMPNAQAVKPVIIETNNDKNDENTEGGIVVQNKTTSMASISTEQRSVAQLPKNTEGVGSAQNTIVGSVSPSTEQRSVAQLPQNTEGVGSAQNTITGSVSPSTEQRSVAQLPKNTEGVSLNNDIGINKNQNTNIDIEHDVAIQNEIAQKIDNQNIISKIDTAYSDNTVKNNTAITSLKEDNNTKNIISKIDVSEHNIQQIRAISTLELLPILPSKEITFDKPLSHIALPITQPIYGRIVSVNIKDRPHFGLTMGAHTEGVTMIDGYQAGVFIQQKLPSKLPLSLQIGLNYRNTNTTGDSSGTAVFDPSSVSGASPNQNAFVITQASLNNISYIEMPIFLTYSPSKKWGIMGGIKGAYMISNKKNTTIWSVNNRYVVENGFSGTLLDMTQFKSANSTLNALDNFSQTLSFNRWDIAVVGGVSYLILPKTTLSLRADWGLKNVLNKQNWSANNRLLGLNMSYQF